MATPKPGPAQEKRSYILSPDTGTVYCYKSDVANQLVTSLWEATELSSFHDAVLAEATEEINAILKRIEKGNRDPERTLSFVSFQNRLLLVWASYGMVGPHDDDATIIKALRLKASKSSRRGATNM